jgi:mRNA-degrading endonuclease toxin of MazEF toxin-antitoxin module
MNTRESLLSMIDTLPDEELDSLISFAPNLSSKQRLEIMITSRVERSSYPSRVLVRLDSIEGQQSGLLSDSVVMTDDLAPIAATEIGRRIGAIAMTTVDNALRYT